MVEIVAEGRNLVKRYGDKTVVNGIRFQIKRGECFGFLGPNGAGKTSTMKMMYCRVSPDFWCDSEPLRSWVLMSRLVALRSKSVLVWFLKKTALILILRC